MEVASNLLTGKDAGSINPLQLVGMLRSAGSALVAQVSLHAQLAHIEWQQEKQRLCKMAVFGILGFVFFLCFAIAASAFAILLSWNTPYLIHTFTAVLIVHIVGFVWAALSLKKLAAQSNHSFAATRAEIASDIALLKSAL